MEQRGGLQKGYTMRQTGGLHLRKCTVLRPLRWRPDIDGETRCGGIAVIISTAVPLKGKDRRRLIKYRSRQTAERKQHYRRQIALLRILQADGWWCDV